MICRQIVGVPVGHLLNGDDHECGRPATRFVMLDRENRILPVCPRHAVRFRRQGYNVKELLPI